MTYKKRAYYYVLRKRKKSILISIIFMIALLIGLLGMALIDSFDATLIQIGHQSQAKIIVFISDMEDLILETDIRQLESVDNIDVINRVNESIIRPKQLEISVGDDEDLTEALVRLQGFDDLERESLFARGVTVLLEGNLNIESDEIIIHELFSTLNGLILGDEITFENELGGEKIVTIGGIYAYTDPNIENESHAPSMFRFENLIFAQPDLINELQGEEGYIEVHFYVNDPNLIEETHQLFRQLVSESTFEISVSDMLFRRMSVPLLQTSNLTTLTLLVTGIATVIVISLLLALWSQERKKEVALLLSIGETKIAIFMQRLLEVFSLYIGAFIIVLILSYSISYYSSFLFSPSQLELVEINQAQLTLSVNNILQTFIVGICTLILAVGISCISVMRLMPSKIFSSMD